MVSHIYSNTLFVIFIGTPRNQPISADHDLIKILKKLLQSIICWLLDHCCPCHYSLSLLNSTVSVKEKCFDEISKNNILFFTEIGSSLLSKIEIFCNSGTFMYWCTRNYWRTKIRLSKIKILQNLNFTIRS